MFCAPSKFFLFFSRSAGSWVEDGKRFVALLRGFSPEELNFLPLPSPSRFSFWRQLLYNFLKYPLEPFHSPASSGRNPIKIQIKSSKNNKNSFMATRDASTCACLSDCNFYSAQVICLLGIWPIPLPSSPPVPAFFAAPWKAKRKFIFCGAMNVCGGGAHGKARRGYERKYYCSFLWFRHEAPKPR